LSLIKDIYLFKVAKEKQMARPLGYAPQLPVIPQNEIEHQPKIDDIVIDLDNNLHNSTKKTSYFRFIDSIIKNINIKFKRKILVRHNNSMATVENYTGKNGRIAKSYMNSTINKLMICNEAIDKTNIMYNKVINNYAELKNNINNEYYKYIENMNYNLYNYTKNLDKYLSRHSFHIYNDIHQCEKLRSDLASYHLPADAIISQANYVQEELRRKFPDTRRAYVKNEEIKNDENINKNFKFSEPATIPININITSNKYDSTVKEICDIFGDRGWQVEFNQHNDYNDKEFIRIIQYISSGLLKFFELQKQKYNLLSDLIEVSKHLDKKKINVNYKVLDDLKCSLEKMRDVLKISILNDASNIVDSNSGFSETTLAFLNDSKKILEAQMKLLTSSPGKKSD
jgi:regulator of sigma D